MVDGWWLVTVDWRPRVKHRSEAAALAAALEATPDAVVMDLKP